MVVEGTFQDGSLPGRLPFVDSLVSSYVTDPFWVYLERERERERERSTLGFVKIIDGQPRSHRNSRGVSKQRMHLD